MSKNTPLAEPAAQWRLEPLLAACRELGCRHVSLLGSATRRPLGEVADVDLHLVVPRVERATQEALRAAAEATATDLASRSGRGWRLEWRHGPFKPPPGEPRDLQLHLLLDDESSLAHLPCALLAQRAATGHLLLGELLRRETCAARATWLREARAELERWHGALTRREIAFRHWVLDPAPHLAEGRVPAETAWDLRCLLNGAARATDLCYGAALWMAAEGRAAAGELARPLLAQIGDEPAWSALAADWERVGLAAAAVLAQRLEQLSAL